MGLTRNEELLGVFVVLLLVGLSSGSIGVRGMVVRDDGEEEAVVGLARVSSRVLMVESS